MNSDISDFISQTLTVALQYQSKANLIWNEIKELTTGDAYTSIDTLALICEDQIKTMETMREVVRENEEEFRKDVEQLYQEDLNVLLQLESVFETLRSVSVDDSLYMEMPLDQSYISFTLFDWVMHEDVQRLESQAYKEMAALQKLIKYLEKRKLKLKQKFEIIEKKFHSIDTDGFRPRGSHLQDGVYVQYNAINSGVTFLESTCERIQMQIRSGGSSAQRISVDKNSLSTKLQAIYENLISLETFLDSLLAQRQGINHVFYELNELTELMNLYFEDCQEDYNSLPNLRNMLREHSEGYAPLFNQLNALTEFYSKFSESYDQVIIEIKRRRQVMRDYETKVKQYQNELDQFHRQEMNSRAEFQQAWGQFLPPTMIPSLTETLEPPTIYPARIISNLPDIN